MALHGQLSDLTARRSRYATARPATIRRHMINLAGRIARHASSVTIHLPQHWPLAAAVAAIVRGSARTTRLTIHMRQTAAGAANQDSPTHVCEQPGCRPGDSTHPPILTRFQCDPNTAHAWIKA
jgi:hypothetical protein